MNPLKGVFLALSKTTLLQNLLSTSGPFCQISKRFVSGETLAEGIAASQELNRKGILVSLDYLGESVQDEPDVQAVVEEYLNMIRNLSGQSILNISVSLKLTQLGLAIKNEFCLANMRAIMREAQKSGRLVTIDMEESSYTERTLNIYQILRQEGFANLGIVIQSYLRRSEGDIRNLLPLGPRVRLCKGAYQEPVRIAFPKKKEVDKNYLKLLRILFSKESLQTGTYPEVATHDEKIINWTKSYVRENGIPLDKFEFQMLYGVRGDLQEQLARQGYRIRAYVPYGTHWYPYFMRRLAERPANVIFLLKNLWRR